MVFDRKAYRKEYYEKNKEHCLEYHKEYYEKNKEKMKEYRKEYHKGWREKNKEHLKEYNKQYAETPQGIKSKKIITWKHIGIQCDDEWEEVYEWYSETTNCDICSKLFVVSLDKCLDHDHHLEGYNIRGILCHKCNNVRNEL